MPECWALPADDPALHFIIRQSHDRYGIFRHMVSRVFLYGIGYDLAGFLISLFFGPVFNFLTYTAISRRVSCSTFSKSSAFDSSIVMPEIFSSCSTCSANVLSMSFSVCLFHLNAWWSVLLWLRRFPFFCPVFLLAGSIFFRPSGFHFVFLWFLCRIRLAERGSLLWPSIPFLS